jgi:hypothetical protein
VSVVSRPFSEYRGFARYDAALRDFGALPPLERILNVEAMHIRVLEGLHSRYGVPLTRKSLAKTLRAFYRPGARMRQTIFARFQAGRLMLSDFYSPRERPHLRVVQHETPTPDRSGAALKSTPPLASRER